MRYQLVIFDLDGTILDTLGELTIAFNHALSLSGLDPIDKNTMRSRVGNGARVLVRRSIEGVENADEDKILSDYRDYYNSHCTENTLPYPGIPELFALLKKNNVKIAVVSNKSDAACRKLCEDKFPGLIDVVKGHREDSKHKPDPQLINEVLEELDIDRKKAVIVGDSDVDVLTGVNSGIDNIVVTWGYKSKDVLIENGAKVLVDSCDELIDHLI
ncbi:MAG: HAD family hydrolase [Clostridiales bacterium]|nr:HAD family hydrolase [Clostridiales bacterium]